MNARVRAHVGLGGNRGDVAATLDAAVAAIAALPRTVLVQRSSIFRTPAWGDTAQADFLNAVVALDTGLAAEELLAAMLGIERRHGRERGTQDRRWGPRTLDLDLLLYADTVVHGPGLTLPHPHLHERAFVLVPLAQIAPQLEIPGRGRVADLLAAVDAGGIEALP